MRLVGIGLFTGSKRTYLGPADSTIEVPLIDKRVAQIIAVLPERVQLMDLETYEVFEVQLPKEEEFEGRLEPGRQVEYWSIAGRRKLVKMR